MSCHDCEDVQDRVKVGIPVPEFYMRIGNADVWIVACDKHLTETRDLIRAGFTAVAVTNEGAES